MEYKSSTSFSVPVIDVEATSQNLKRLREERNIKVSEIQKSLNMTYPQAIYTWENPDEKILPTLDHLVALSTIYKVSIDEMIVIKYANDASLTVKEKHPLYGIKKEILNFIANISSSDTKSALENYYRLAI